MATFCANDTCSVALGTDAFGRLQADAILNPAGGISCVDGLGLGINIFGVTGVNPGTLTACDQNLLGMTTDNRLFVRRPGFEVFEAAGNQIDFPDNNIDVTSSHFSITNGAQCTRLFIYRAKMQFNFTVVASAGQIDPDTGKVPYTADGTFHVDHSISNNSPVAAFEIGGAALNNSEHIHTAFLTDWVTFGAGQNVVFDLRAQRNPDQNIAGSGGSNGFLAGFRGVMLDLAQDGSVIA